MSPDIDTCVCMLSLDDVLIGAPLFMARVTEQLQERGQVWSGSTHSHCFQGVRDVFQVDIYQIFSFRWFYTCREDMPGFPPSLTNP